MEKSKGVAYLLWLFSGFGWLGLHRFYLDKWGTGILWILTGGFFGIGSLVDLFTLGGKVEMYNIKLENNEFRKDVRQNMMMTNAAINASVASTMLKNNPKD